MAAQMYPWTALVLTSTRPGLTQVYLREFRRRQKEGLLHPDTWIISVQDPPSTIGSGGATVNALMVATEYLSARNGHTVISADTLRDTSILVLHLGGIYSCDPCGKPLVNLAALETNSTSALSAQVFHLMHALTGLATGAPAGVWVCSTEMLLSLPKDFEVDWSSGNADAGVDVVTVPGPRDHAKGHGVYRLSEDGKSVESLLYRASDDAIDAVCRKDGSCSLVSGIVRISIPVAVRLLELHDRPPLDACTYFGLDNGAEPLRLSLFLDIISSMLPGSAKTFLESSENELHQRARKELLSAFQGTSVRPIVVEGGSYIYMPANFAAFKPLLFANSPLRAADEAQLSAPRLWTRLAHTVNAAHVPETAVIINSSLSTNVRVGGDTAICHSDLRSGSSSFGSNCYVSGVELDDSSVISLPDDMVLMQLRVNTASLQKDKSAKVWVMLGINDVVDPAVAASQPSGTLFNESFESLSKRTGIESRDLWRAGDAQTAATAKLFILAHLCGTPSLNDITWMLPTAGQDAVKQNIERWRQAWRVSLLDLLAVSDLDAELGWREKIYASIGEANIKAALHNAEAVSIAALQKLKPGEPSQCISPFLEFCAVTSRFGVLKALDEVAATTESFGVAARALASIADVLGAFARGRGGLRSGPGRNESFQAAYACLEKRQLAQGVQLLAKERAHWLSSPESLVRAARHYEAAAQILIRQAVSTAREFVNISQGPLPPLNRWEFAESPARIDLAGGWSDTPPLTYEHGGAVVNAAVTIDGKRPIGAKCRRIAEPQLVLVLVGSSTQRLVLTELDELRNYTQPQAPGALLKAAFCCAGIVNMDEPASLAEQLQTRYKGGFELHSWSNLPHGSGLGTSSILAGAVMAAVYRAAGVQFSVSDLNHSVLHLEQMLTTGGGWQDQVGGLVGGVKLTTSPGELPVRIDVKSVGASTEFVEKFGKHLVLIYTGKTRLARNLLQNVVRNWYARSPFIVANMDALTENAEGCARAFRTGDLAAIGKAINLYWEQKKVMAPGCEPAFVRRMMDIFEPYAYGQTLVGAGGGGFMYVLSKEPNATSKLQGLIKGDPELADVRFHEISVDVGGLTMRSE